MRLSQLADPTIGPFLVWIEEGQSRPPWQEISHISDDFQSVQAQWGRLELCNGFVFRTSFPDRNQKM